MKASCYFRAPTTSEHFTSGFTSSLSLRNNNTFFKTISGKKNINCRVAMCCEPLILFTYILVDIKRHVTLTYCIVVTSVLTRDIFLHAFAMQLNDDSIDVLVGADHYWDLVTGDVVTAIDSKLGWLLSGPAESMNPRR